MPIPPRARNGFKIAIICALTVEAESVRAVFDKCWEDEGNTYGKAYGDKNTYTTGVIGRYNVVLVLLPSTGGVPAAQAAASLTSSFPKIELVLVVGVCGVVPKITKTQDEIILGDVIVSTAMTQYDFGQIYPSGFLRKTSVQDSLRKAPKELQGFMNKLNMRQNREKLRADLTRLVGSPQFQQSEPTAVYPGAEEDRLYKRSYLHQHRPPVKCDECREDLDAICSQNCDELKCDIKELVPRERLRRDKTHSLGVHPDGGPRIYLGRIGSANTVIKSGEDRDMLATNKDLIAFEMEGAGVWDEHPTIVIKGACNYADSHKQKAWQPYAAMMAAGCLKVVLNEWVESDDLLDYDALGPCLASAPLIRSDEFVGRTSEIDAIYHVLRPNEATSQQRRVVLGGIGGVSKTQLALTYARRYERSYTSVLWLNATSELSLYTSIHSAAQGLITSHELERLENDQVLARVKEWLSHPDNRQWLLIFDNYDEPDQFDIDSFYPNIGHGSIIVTTRLPNDVRDCHVVLVQALTAIEDSLDILWIRSGREKAINDIDARRVAERMAGLPLALVTAGAYLRKNNTTFQQYLNAYEQRWQVDRRRPPQIKEYQDRTLYTTWNLSYSRLEVDDPLAAQMLQLLAYFDHQAVGYELFQAGLSDHAPTWLRESLFDPIDFENMMGTLIDYCLVEVQHATRSYSIHKCVHDWTLGALNREVNTQSYWYAFECVVASINESDADTLGELKYSLLSQHGARLTHHRFEQCDKLGLLEHLGGASSIALMLQEQVQLSAAEKMYVRALAGKEKVLGPDHTSTLDTVNNLGGLYKN